MCQLAPGGKAEARSPVAVPAGPGRVAVGSLADLSAQSGLLCVAVLGWTGWPLSFEGAHFPPTPSSSIMAKRLGSAGTRPKKGARCSWLLVTGPELTEQCAGRAWNPQGPVSAFSTCVGPAGGPQLYFGSWPSAVNRFTPYRRMARVHTGEVTCLARRPGLGPW